MTSTLPRAQWLKLVRILGVLGSDQAGERASAALAAHRLVKASGLDWAGLLTPRTMSTTERRQPRGPFRDAFHDPQAAARSRINQLTQDVQRLETEVTRLRRLLRERRERLVTPPPDRPGSAPR